MTGGEFDYFVILFSGRLHLLTERGSEAATKPQLGTSEVEKLLNWCQNYNLKG